MEPYKIIEPGSLDIEEVHLRIGRVEIDSLERLREMSGDFTRIGNKFVIAEHFIDPDGNPILEDVQFNSRHHCYSLFVDKVYFNGRHASIIPNHRRKGFEDKTGRIVGGGMIRSQKENEIQVVFSSGDYKSEPEYLRAQFAILLRAQLSKDLDKTIEIPESTIDQKAFYTIGNTNAYWLRFSQVLEAAKTEFKDNEQSLKKQLDRFWDCEF